MKELDKNHIKVYVECKDQNAKIKVLEEAIQAIAGHPTLDEKAKHRGIKPLRLALARLQNPGYGCIH